MRPCIPIARKKMRGIFGPPAGKIWGLCLALMSMETRVGTFFPGFQRVGCGPTARACPNKFGGVVLPLEYTFQDVAEKKFTLFHFFWSSARPKKCPGTFLVFEGAMSRRRRHRARENVGCVFPQAPQASSAKKSGVLFLGILFRIPLRKKYFFSEMGHFFLVLGGRTFF